MNRKQDCCEVVKRCRSRVYKLEKSQRETFLMEQFRNSIDDTVGEVNGNLKFKMDFKLCLDITNESYKVCRKVFAYCWGITEYEIKQISRALKVADGGYCDSYKPRILTESTNLGNVI